MTYQRVGGAAGTRCSRPGPASESLSEVLAYALHGSFSRGGGGVMEQGDSHGVGRCLRTAAAALPHCRGPGLHQ